MPRHTATALLIVALAALARPAHAHHSFAAEYDAQTVVALKGVVTKVEWTNPHAYIYIDVADGDGKVANWAFEGMAPGVLYRAGWRKDSMKVADVVTVKGYLARDGSKLVNMQSALLADGRNLFVGQQPASKGH